MTARSPLRLELGRTGSLALPLVGGQLAHMGMGFVDTLMMGRYSTTALAGVAVGNSLWSPASLFALGILLAIPPSISRLSSRAGAFESGEIDAVVRQALWIAFGLSVALGTVLVRAEHILPWMKVVPEILPSADSYLAGLVWGVPAWAATLALRFACEGLGNTKPTLWLSVLGLPVNAGANAVLIYGAAGIPPLGALGCGLATALVWWLQLAGVVVYLRTSESFPTLRGALRWERPDATHLRPLLALGIPIGLTVFFEVGLFGASGLLVASLGVVEAAGHHIALNVTSVLFMIPLGIALALTIRVGAAAGADDREGVVRAAGVGTALAMGAQLVSITIMLTLPGRIARLYTQDPQLIELTRVLLRLAAAFQISDGLQVCAAAALRGLHDTRIPMVLTLVSYWGIGLPLAWYLGIRAGGGPPGVWVGLVAGLTAAAISLGYRFHVRTRPGIPLTG